LDVRHHAAIDRLVAVLRAHLEGPPSARPNIAVAAELACLRGLLSEQTLRVAARGAQATGVGADRVLIHADMLDEELYVRALADALGVGFEMLETGPAACPIDARKMLDAPAAGVLPLIVDGDLKIVIAPQGIGARGLADFLDHHPQLARRFRLTTSERLRAFVWKHGEAAVAHHASANLAKTWPESSAAPLRRRRKKALRPLALAVGCALILGVLAAPELIGFACSVAASVVFLAWAVLRVVAATIGPPPAVPRAAPLRDPDLPTYSVLVPLYREAPSVKGLLAALRELDYPPEKLDIKLIVERDDAQTIAAIHRQRPAPHFQIVIVPPQGPRTKPKALNAALPLARGGFVVVYDAEDRPDRDQLRRALDAFRRHGDRLACVQASLTIDNSADNWLTAIFAAEYAGQFDVFLPALTRLAMPLPLGGSSNHFRTSVLRAVGEWDPYNVTEDADLGMRLARFGYRSIALLSSTYEEAPPRLGPWLRQRTRWFKGWMQTWWVQTRSPIKLLRELGPLRFAVVQLIVGGTVLASLVHPIMLAWLTAAALRPGPIFISTPTGILFETTIAGGYIASTLLGGVGLHRRGLLKQAWVLLLVPAYWLLLAAAAWRALYQLLTDPYRWEKTDHGLARTSRISAAPSAATASETLKPRRAAPALAAAPSRGLRSFTG
jgi:cellulose synthase/poly-beta-1,6-N-acetylglucosamine synthase-like glycosyltransferase